MENVICFDVNPIYHANNNITKMYSHRDTDVLFDNVTSYFDIATDNIVIKNMRRYLLVTNHTIAMIHIITRFRDKYIQMNTTNMYIEILRDHKYYYRELKTKQTIGFKNGDIIRFLIRKKTGNLGIYVSYIYFSLIHGHSNYSSF